ncbi:MAG: hypothetical protein ABJH82_01030 [Polaribacter sp.]|uniref:hypothetical protein n=1 Tax=Polaribacter sp. TaxID=1920175 RepID=UPI003263806B
MKKNLLNSFLIIVMCFVTANVKSQSLDYVMDMVHNNPGEKPFKTKYRNPAYIKSQGFNAMVPHWYINCAITYDNVKENIVSKGSEERTWIENKAKYIQAKLDSCEQHNVAVYPFTDFLVFPKSIWKKYGGKISKKGTLHNLGGDASQAVKPNIQSKTTQKLLRAQIDGVFKRFPNIDGLTVRFGETYLHDAPFHRGGSPISRGKQGIEDHITLINILREEICVKRNKKLFYRTWDFGGFHTNPNYYLKVTNAIETHKNLVFSIKYQKGDFHRMTPFNPCIGIGKHKQIVESQSRMEAYGKGAHPYYTASGVINGWPETKYEISRHHFTGKTNSTENPRGLKDILKNNLLTGIVTWSNGGGWKGPYIKHELWADLNTYVVSQWAQNPNKSEKEIFYKFASKLGLHGYQADLFRKLNMLSIEGVRKGHCNSYAENAVWWTRDEYFSAKQNKPIIKEIIQNKLVDEVLAEKAESVFIWHQIEALSKQIKINDVATQEALEVSSTYGRIKYELIEQMWIMMLYKELDSVKNKQKILENALVKYDALWLEWKTLYNSSPLCATIYTDKYLWDKREGSIGEFVDDKIRPIVNKLK